MKLLEDQFICDSVREIVYPGEIFTNLQPRKLDMQVSDLFSKRNEVLGDDTLEHVLNLIYRRIEVREDYWTISVSLHRIWNFSLIETASSSHLEFRINLKNEN